MKHLNCANLVASLTLVTGAFASQALAHETTGSLAVAPHAATVSEAAFGKTNISHMQSHRQLFVGQQQQQQQQQRQQLAEMIGLDRINAEYANTGFSV